MWGTAAYDIRTTLTLHTSVPSLAARSAQTGFNHALDLSDQKVALAVQT